MKSLHDIRTEYSARPLLIEELAADPAKQFTDWFGEIEKLDIVDSNAATLSSYDNKSKRVRARIVLIKEITKSGIIFFSNYESDKGSEIFFSPSSGSDHLLDISLQTSQN
jgi:pyridoxamine 5'-phosphate oxidase